MASGASVHIRARQHTRARARTHTHTRARAQAALLYTTPSGQRRIRVHTVALPVTDNVSTVFKVRLYPGGL